MMAQYEGKSRTSFTASHFSHPSTYGVVRGTQMRFGESYKTIRVLRCLVWVVTSSGSWIDVELAGQQIDHGGEVSNGTVTASLCLGGLHQAVDPLDQPIGNLAV